MIASEGRSSLYRLLNVLCVAIDCGSECIVCLPPRADTQSLRQYRGVKIILSKVKGQILQRCMGVSLATRAYVLQLDDDIQLDISSIDRLLKEVKKDVFMKTVGGLNMIFEGQQNDRRRGRQFIDTLNDYFYFVFAGAPLSEQARGGKLTSVGKAFPVARRTTPEKQLEVDWLFGACMLYPRIAFPRDVTVVFEGKAFGEDIIMSAILKQKGYKKILILDDFFLHPKVHSAIPFRIEVLIMNQVRKELRGGAIRFVIFVLAYFFYKKAFLTISVRIKRIFYFWL